VGGRGHQREPAAPAQGVAEGMLLEFMERLSKVRVLDPACGSGNFLYVALNQLKNLEKEVWAYASGVGLAQPELGVSPAQLHGIEKNQFAAELAQVVVWIGYLQWKHANGFFDVQEPILQNLHNIECRDAILTVDLNGQPAEPPWPEADVIVGNPPFHGDKRRRGELGDEYVENLRKLYEGNVPPDDAHHPRQPCCARRAATNARAGVVVSQLLSSTSRLLGCLVAAWGILVWLPDQDSNLEPTE
jgi:hypothetical protein